jgi:hypothetical protein
MMSEFLYLSLVEIDGVWLYFRKGRIEIMDSGGGESQATRDDFIVQEPCGRHS